MNHEHLLKEKFVGINGWGGSPKITEGNPNIFACSISIGELDSKKDFFPDRFVRV